MVKSERKILYLALALVGVSYLVHFVFLGFLIGPFDYDHLSAYYDLAWRFWQTGSSLPHYNPYLCGGRTLGADPQIPIFHPLILLVPVLGPTWLIKLEMLTQLAVGTWALRHWLKRWGMNEDQILWGVFLYLSGGGVISRFLVGHVTLGFYFLFPVFFYLSYRLGESQTHFPKRLTLAYWLLFVYSGLYKPNFLIYAVPLLLLETILRTIFERKPRILLHFVVAVTISAIANAPTHLPAMHYFTLFPRRQDGLSSFFIPFYTMLANFLLPLKTIPKAWYGNGGFLQRHEYNYFLGPVALYFMYVGKPLARSHTHRWERLSLFIFAVLSLWVGMGAFDATLSPVLPFTWLRPWWPGFASARVPPRFWYGAFLAAILFSSQGFRFPKAGSFAYWLFLTAGILPLVGIAVVNLGKTTVQAPISQWVSPRLYPKEIHLVTGDVNHGYESIRKGIGVLTCVANLAIDQSPLLVEGNSLKYASSSPVTANLSWQGWNQILVDAITPTPDPMATPFSLSLNLNPSPYWHFDGMGRLTQSKGTPLTLVSEGPHLKGVLTFLQPWVRESLLLATIGWSGILLLAFFAWRKR